MSDCLDINKRQVPLMKVVKAAIVDVYGNITELQQLYSHWAARGLKMLQTEVLKVGVRKVLIPVNRNTMTATLPLDFGEDTFVGFVNNGYKSGMRQSHRLADISNIEEIPFEDVCSSCGEDRTICEDLAITEESELVVINASTYENKVIKKLYPNGDYYTETTKWFKNLDTGLAEQAPVQREFVTNFDLKPCGCLQKSDVNIAKLKDHCYSNYCCNFSGPCREVSTYEYAIHEDTGFMQVEHSYPYDFVYLEYLGFMPKKNGQYMVPEVAFETLVEWIKWKAIKDKKGVERWRINDTKDDYIAARKMMMKVLTRVSLSTIISRLRSIPKFNLDYDDSWYRCFDPKASVRLLPPASTSTGNSTSTVINNYPSTIINNASYQLSVKTGAGPGHPVDDTSSYQNNVLKEATDINFIILAKQILTKDDGDFTHDPIEGKINLTSLKFFTDDVLVVPYNKTT